MVGLRCPRRKAVAGLGEWHPLPLSLGACLTPPWGHISQTPDGDIATGQAPSCLGWWWALRGFGLSWAWVQPHPLPRGASAFPSFRFLHVWGAWDSGGLTGAGSRKLSSPFLPHAHRPQEARGTGRRNPR